MAVGRGEKELQKNVLERRRIGGSEWPCNLFRVLTARRRKFQGAALMVHLKAGPALLHHRSPVAGRTSTTKPIPNCFPPLSVHQSDQ
jgi:hypothetical protein